jgi:uncharacterized protein
MKYLLLIALALLLVWWWRTATRNRNTDAPAQTGAPKRPAPQDMVACRQCGLHLPRAEAIASGQGVYCSDAHRRAVEEPADPP